MCDTCEFWCGGDNCDCSCGCFAWIMWIVISSLAVASFTGICVEALNLFSSLWSASWMVGFIFMGVAAIIIYCGCPRLDRWVEGWVTRTNREYKERWHCFVSATFLVFLGSMCIMAAAACATFWGVRISITSAACTTCNGQTICPVMNGSLILNVTSDYYRDVYNTRYNSTEHNYTGYNGTEYGPLVAHQYALFKDNLFMFFQIVAGTFPDGTEPGVNTSKCECDDKGGWSPSYKSTCEVTPEWECNPDPWEPKPTQDCQCGPDHTCTLRPTIVSCDCDDNDCGNCDCTGIPDGQSCNGTCNARFLCDASNPTCQSVSCECESCTCEVTVHARKA